MVKKLLLALVLVAFVWLLVGCNTVQGIGEDITWIGRKGSQVVGP